MDLDWSLIKSSPASSAAIWPVSMAAYDGQDRCNNLLVMVDTMVRYGARLRSWATVRELGRMTVHQGNEVLQIFSWVVNVVTTFAISMYVVVFQFHVRAQVLLWSQRSACSLRRKQSK